VKRAAATAADAAATTSTSTATATASKRHRVDWQCDRDDRARRCGEETDLDPGHGPLLGCCSSVAQCRTRLAAEVCEKSAVILNHRAHSVIGFCARSIESRERDATVLHGKRRRPARACESSTLLGGGAGCYGQKKRGAL
jgi:hypothetical protein